MVLSGMMAGFLYAMRLEILHQEARAVASAAHLPFVRLALFFFCFDL